MDISELITNLDPTNPAKVKELQQALQVKGYDVVPDGKIGSRTSQAIGQWRADQEAIANRGVKTKELENQAQERSWQNQAMEVAKYGVIPAGMGGGHLIGKGLENRQLATEALQRTGVLPNPAQNWSPTRRFMGRMAPYAGFGGFLGGEGYMLREMVAPGIKNETGQEIARLAGSGSIGAGIGVLGHGLKGAFQPQALPSPMGAPNLPMGPGGPGLPPPGAGPMGAEPPALPPPPETPPPAEPPLRRPSDRLISAARAAGAPSGVNKTEAADHLLAEGNITPENRTAVAAELGVKSGPNYASRIADRIKLLKTSRTPLAIVGAAGALGYDMGQNDAEAAGLSPDEAVSSGLRGAAISGGGAAAGMYGMSKLGPLTRAVAGGMMEPIAAMTGPDFTAESEQFGRNNAIRDMPWLRHLAPIYQQAYDESQVPTRNPLRVPMGASGDLPVGPGRGPY